MSLALHAAGRYLPGPVRRAALRELFAVTADAFGEPRPDLRGHGHEEQLGRYAVGDRSSPRLMRPPYGRGTLLPTNDHHERT